MTQQSQDTPRPEAGALDVRRVRTHHLREAKRRGEKFTMLTSYDALTAAIFDAAGVDTLLVGDSAGNNVLGYATTLPVTVDELLPLCRAVSGAVERAFVVVDLPFGSYEGSPEQAVATAVRFLKEGGAHAVKLEGGAWFAPHVRAMTQAGVPVVAHVGFTPQSEHALGGYRVQGRGDAARTLLEDARALQDAGAFCVLMEMVPAEAAAAVDAALEVPTVGIGAGAATTGQVLVWQDMLGLRQGRLPRFVHRYADLHGVVSEAVGRYVEDVRTGRFPGPEHSY
ncbi:MULTISPECIES: 3-methyl-2-oxobutanoate hydroxymethyltransferase [Kocuria]|jgi:3-methyl-2-oxobutanoate hydroxymethyltransferase|uniref:3-methyl-2-oxobutanoate hydroxymethyltransferase n=1 Tax=Kocuria TaxID=57493 RepID=UPI00203E6693|nr:MULTISPECIES: 3-methyl-2-oxobutanoate hydroxymethyltransferase [Kocuria]MCM3688349.1 3-methyl-2-oxobutanoate hydroxymethyltransferase [Kocuria rosea]